MDIPRKKELPDQISKKRKSTKFDSTSNEIIEIFALLLCIILSTVDDNYVCETDDLLNLSALLFCMVRLKPDISDIDL